MDVFADDAEFFGGGRDVRRGRRFDGAMKTVVASNQDFSSSATSLHLGESWTISSSVHPSSRPITAPALLRARTLRKPHKNASSEPSINRP
jgi:hypothetical protein